jgi:hypothetical protein
MAEATKQQIDWRALRLRFGQRPIDPGNVEKLKRSIAKHGYWAGYPIVINQHGEILVGQHRWIACKELDTEPVVVITDDIPATTIIDLEKTGKKWSTRDKLDAQAALGNEASKTIIAISDEFNVSPRSVMQALGRDNNIERIMGVVITDEEAARARRIIRDMTMFDEVLGDGKVSKLSRVIGAYVRIEKLPLFDRDRMRERMHLNGRQMFVYCSSSDAQVRNLIDIYNYRTQEQHRLYVPAQKRK